MRPLDWRCNASDLLQDRMDNVDLKTIIFAAESDNESGELADYSQGTFGGSRLSFDNLDRSGDILIGDFGGRFFQQVENDKTIRMGIISIAEIKNEMVQIEIGEG